MAVTVTTTPTYPKPGRVTLTFACTAGGTALRAWCTNAPLGSKLRKELDTAEANTTAVRVPIAGGQILAPGVTVDLNLEVGGVYTIAAQELTYGATTWGGGYSADPRGFRSETKIGGESILSVYVGQRIVSPIGSPEYGLAELVLWIWNDTIRATTITTHGEKTPVIVAKNERAATAVGDATVAASLAALVDVSTTTLLGDLEALHQELRNDIPLHFNDAVHATPDATNDTEIENLPKSPKTPAGYALCAQIFRKRLFSHMSNDNAGGFMGAGAFHNVAGKKADFENALIAVAPGSAATMAQVWIEYADIYRAYVAHIADTDFHSSADATNTITATLPQLCGLHRDFLNAQRTMTPTAPAYVNPGVTRLIHAAGFTERNL